jgi:hypothetical protein
MNRILYFLIGGCAAGMIALAFFQKRDIGSSTDVVATFVFLSVLAAATCILLHSRWGRRLSSRIQQKAIEEDERVHSNARTKVGYARHLLVPCPETSASCARSHGGRPWRFPDGWISVAVIIAMNGPCHDAAALCHSRRLFQSDIAAR